MGTARRRFNAQADLGRRVARERKRRGWSQEQLAERMHRDATYISMIERGVSNPSFENLLRLAKALEVDPAALVRGLRPDS